MRADARELLEKQRITSGLAEDPVALVRFLDPGEQRLGRNPIERLHVEDNGDAARRSRRGEQTGCRVARSEHQHEQVRTGWRPAEHVVEKLERRLVSPVDVIQDESDGLARAEGVEEVTHRPVKPPAIRRCAPRSPARDFVLRSSGNTVASPPSRSSPSSRSSEAGTSRRAGSRASMTGANGTCARRSSAARPSRTTNRRCIARSRATSSSRVLPIPASPRRTTSLRSPLATAAAAAAIASHSASRPSSVSPDTCQA